MDSPKKNGEEIAEVTPEEVANTDEDIEIVSDEVGGEEETEIEGSDDPLNELESQLEDKHNRLLRAMADMDNLRKRCRRDVDDALVRGRSEVLTELLPAVDSLDLALGTISPDAGAKPVLDGMEMVRKQFLTGMERFGLKPVKAIGAVFDPTFHEAVSQLPSNEFEQGLVCQEMRKGYVLGDRLLRASMVVVSSGLLDETIDEEVAKEPAAVDVDENGEGDFEVPEVPTEEQEVKEKEIDGDGDV